MAAIRKENSFNGPCRVLAKRLARVKKFKK
jgi:hypothetical protein